MPVAHIGDVYVKGHPLAIADAISHFDRLTDAQRQRWLQTNLVSVSNPKASTPKALLDLVELIPIELGATFRGVLGFGPIDAAGQQPEDMMDQVHQKRLVFRARKYLTNGLAAMAEKQEMAEMLGRFSHILRGPLQALQGAAEAMRDQVADEEDIDPEALREISRDIQDYIDGIAEQAEMIEQAKASGLGERGDPQFHRAPLFALVKQVWRAMARRAGLERGITATGINGLQSLPDVEIESNLMRIVFVNLFHNALKYAHFNKDIELSSKRITVDGRPWVRVCVADFGIGIREDELRRIFLPNFRGTIRDAMRDIEGVGMGLAVCKEIVEDVHGGRIWARSTEKGGQQGSLQHCRVEFLVELPVDQNGAKSKG